MNSDPNMSLWQVRKMRSQSVCVEMEKRDGLIGENFRFASKVFPDQQWSCPMSIFDKGRCCAGEDLSHSLKKDNYFWSEGVGGSWLVLWEIISIETAIFILLRWTLCQSTSNCFRGEAAKPNALGPSGFSWRRGQNPSIDRCGTMLHHILVAIGPLAFNFEDWLDIGPSRS